MICDTKSGGVISAETMARRRYPYFRVFFRSFGVTIPITVKNIKAKGTSNKNPSGIVDINKKEKYSFVVINM